MERTGQSWTRVGAPAKHVVEIRRQPAWRSVPVLPSQRQGLQLTVVCTRVMLLTLLLVLGILANTGSQAPVHVASSASPGSLQSVRQQSSSSNNETVDGTLVAKMVHAIFAGLIYLITLGAAGFLLYHRRWPPFRARHGNLMVLMAVSSSICLAGTGIAFGMLDWAVSPQSCLESGRGAGRFVVMISMGSFFGCLTCVRTYRVFKILVLRRAEMWRVPLQLLVSWAALATLPMLLLFTPELTCSPPGQDQSCLCHDSLWLSSLFSVMHAIMSVVWISVHTYMLSHLKSIPSLWNEVQRFRGFVLIYSFSILAVCLSVLLPAEAARHLRFAGAWVMPVFLFWEPFWTPFRKYIAQDHRYIRAFVQQEFDIEALDDRIGAAPIEEMMTHRDFLQVIIECADERLCRENVDFLIAVDDRNKTPDFERRLRKSMYIIDTYVRDGARHQVNLSGTTREQLETTSSPFSATLFDKAKAEVLWLIEHDIKAFINNSAKMRELKEKVRSELRVMSMMAALDLTTKRWAQVDKQRTVRLKKSKRRRTRMRVAPLKVLTRGTSAVSVIPQAGHPGKSEDPPPISALPVVSGGIDVTAHITADSHVEAYPPGWISPSGLGSSPSTAFGAAQPSDSKTANLALSPPVVSSAAIDLSTPPANLAWDRSPHSAESTSTQLPSLSNLGADDQGARSS